MMSEDDGLNKDEDVTKARKRPPRRKRSEPENPKRPADEELRRRTRPDYALRKRGGYEPHRIENPARWLIASAHGNIKAAMSRVGN
jgi:hypothetical protein